MRARRSIFHAGWVTGLRIPESKPESRRVENRATNANPYLAIAATLARGFLGMVEKIEPIEQIEPIEPIEQIEPIEPIEQIEPGAPCKGSSLEEGYPFTLANDSPRAMALFKKPSSIHEILGQPFVNLFLELESVEYQDFVSTVSSWEREYLMMSV